MRNVEEGCGYSTLMSLSLLEKQYQLGLVWQKRCEGSVANGLCFLASCSMSSFTISECEHRHASEHSEFDRGELHGTKVN